jgi:acetyl esterase/lipase
VIFFHGGFWRAEYDRAHVAPLAQALAEAGFIAATPEYRRTGAGGGWPATFDDVRAAVAATPGLVADRSPGPTVLAGHSAGGHLALWAAAESGLGYPVLALAPVCDLRAAYELDLDGGAVVDLLDGGPQSHPQRYADADPMARQPPPGTVGLVHGARDDHVPVSFSQRYAEAAQRAGGSVRLTVLPEADHFAVIDPLSSAWSVVISVLSEIVGTPPPTLTPPGHTR